MAIEVEYEKTYLLDDIPGNLTLDDGTEMVDIYIPERADHPNLRLRQMGTDYTITKKVMISDDDASTQVEHTIRLTADEFAALKSSSSRRVEKQRYTVDIDGRTAEIDKFTGQLEGLVLADFEFETKDEMELFVPPAFCVGDVTQEEAIAGGKLAGSTFDQVKAKLGKYYGGK